MELVDIQVTKVEKIKIRFLPIFPTSYLKQTGNGEIDIRRKIAESFYRKFMEYVTPRLKAQGKHFLSFS